MSRPSKTQVKAREEMKIRADKAQTSIVSAFAKLIAKHVDGLIVQPGSDTSARAQIELVLTPDGNAALRMTYQKTVSDGAGFMLDDGQADLPLTPPAPPPAGTAATGGNDEG